MQRLYRIDVIAHFKPARYSSTYWLSEDAKDEFYHAKKLWEGDPDQGEYGYDDFARIPGAQKTAVQVQIYALEQSGEYNEEALNKLYAQLDELEDDTLVESWYQRDLCVKVEYPYIVLDEFEAYTE